MKYRLKDSVTHTMMINVGISCREFIEALRTNPFEIREDGVGGFVGFENEMTITTRHSEPNVNGWGLPISYVEPVTQPSS